MKLYQRFVPLFCSFLLLITLAFSVNAQTAKTNFNRVSDYDVQHYVLRISFDRAAKRVFGDTTVQLKPATNNFRRVELDAAALDFSSVQIEPENKDLQFLADSE
jgi:aminopeptidase N